MQFIYDLFKRTSLTKKELLDILKSNNVKPKKIFKGMLSITQYYKEQPLEIKFFIVLKNVLHITIDQKDVSAYTATSFFNTVKENVEDKLSIPSVDSTKHQQPLTVILWENNVVLSMTYSHTDNELSLFKSYVLKPKEQTNKSLFIGSMIGGLAWGLIMFGAMGLDFGYSLFDFGLWLLGGILFGLILFIVLFFTAKVGSIKPKKLQFSPKEKRFFKSFIDKNYPNLYKLESYSNIKVRHKIKSVPLTILLDETELILLFKIGFHIQVEKLPYQEVDKFQYYKFGNEQEEFMHVFSNNNLNSFTIHTKASIEPLRDILVPLLGFDSAHYQNLLKEVIKAFEAYDPCDFIKGGTDKDSYRHALDNILMTIYKKETVTELDIEEQFKMLFDFLPIPWTEFSKIVYQLHKESLLTLM